MQLFFAVYAELETFFFLKFPDRSHSRCDPYLSRPSRLKFPLGASVVKKGGRTHCSQVKHVNCVNVNIFLELPVVRRLAGVKR